MTKSRNILAPRHRFTEIEITVVRENYADSRTDDIARALGLKPWQVNKLAMKLGVKKSRVVLSEIARERMSNPDHAGRTTQFKKGVVPANKGMKRPGWATGRMGETQFKKGSKPHTWVPVGSYRINGDGYLDRKVNDSPGPNHVRWHPVHRLLWEEAHGEVPAGHVAVFKPGRRTTVLEQITLDAVELITRSELMARNTIHNYPPELRSVIRLAGKVRRKLDEREEHQ